MNTIKGLPAYFEKFVYDVLVITKLPGVPTFSMT